LTLIGRCALLHDLQIARRVSAVCMAREWSPCRRLRTPHRHLLTSRLLYVPDAGDRATFDLAICICSPANGRSSCPVDERALPVPAVGDSRHGQDDFFAESEKKNNTMPALRYWSAERKSSAVER